MERLVFRNENWYVNDEVSQKLVTKINLPDFRGEVKECWHLRGRGSRWLTLISDFTGLESGKEYLLSFWGKFDYYSGYGTRCFINVYENKDGRVIYNINPYCPYASASAGGWYLYRIPIKFLQGNSLKVELISFEANIAILPANHEDENDPAVSALQENERGKSYYINEELPYSEYANLEQRMVKYYSDLLAPYHPAKEIPEACQYEYYEFVKGLYYKLFTRPEEFFTKLNADDAFPNRFNCSEYGKPELKPNMKKDRNKIEELFQLLLTIGSTGDETEEGLLIKSPLSKKQKAMLAYMDLDITDGILKHKAYPNLHQAIKYLAGKENPLWLMPKMAMPILALPFLAFQFCWFDSSYPYLEKTHEKFYDREQYQRLTGWLKEKGYRSSVRFDTTLTLDYTKSIGNKEKPVGYALFGDKYHYGFTFEFRPDPRIMQHCELRIIQYAGMLKRFDDLSDKTKQLIRLRTKICDGCRYCIQTDKTGKRPIAAIKLSDGTARCPYYPGFSFTYEMLTKQDVDDIMAFLTDLERIVTDN